jgi:hypothetical protein
MNILFVIYVLVIRPILNLIRLVVGLIPRYTSCRWWGHHYHYWLDPAFPSFDWGGSTEVRCVVCMRRASFEEMTADKASFPIR